MTAGNQNEVDLRAPDESGDAPAGPAADAPGGAAPLELQREVQELRDKNLRLMAEAQNLQKRTQRDKQEALRYAQADFARDLLVVLDDFERTLEAARSAADPAALADGVRIVYEHLGKILRTHGVTPIDAVGQPFDPDLHEAVLQQPSAGQPAGHVAQELARGYRMHDRVLRPARVIVSGGPWSSPSEPDKEP